MMTMATNCRITRQRMMSLRGVARAAAHHVEQPGEQHQGDDADGDRGEVVEEDCH